MRHRIQRCCHEYIVRDRVSIHTLFSWPKTGLSVCVLGILSALTQSVSILLSSTYSTYHKLITRGQILMSTRRVNDTIPAYLLVRCEKIIRTQVTVHTREKVTKVRLCFVALLLCMVSYISRRGRNGEEGDCNTSYNCTQSLCLQDLRIYVACGCLSPLLNLGRPRVYIDPKQRKDSNDSVTCVMVAGKRLKQTCFTINVV